MEVVLRENRLKIPTTWAAMTHTLVSKDVEWGLPQWILFSPDDTMSSRYDHFFAKTIC